MIGPQRRRLGSLLSAWAAAVLLAAALYWLGAALPALLDILTPMYLVLGVVMLVVTWKWFRGREGHRDRRQADRRHVPPEPPIEHQTPSP